MPHGSRPAVASPHPHSYSLGVPVCNQAWDPHFHERSRLFDVYGTITSQFAGRGEWPGPAEFTAAAEAQRLDRAPEERRLEFVLTQPKSRRTRQRKVDANELYDGRIVSRGEIPCLPASYHDLFNAIVFAAFPRSKRALHARQHAVQKTWVPAGALRLPSRRTREQDALTIFDEGGSIVVMTESAHQAWRQSKEPLLLELDKQVQVLLFGHAIMELLHELPAAPRASIRSCAVVLAVAELNAGNALLTQVDQWLAQRLSDPTEFLAPKGDTVLVLEADGSLRLGTSHQIEDRPDT